MTHSFLTVTIPFDDSRTAAVERYLKPFGNLAREEVTEAARGLRADLDAANLIHFLSINVLPGNRTSRAHLLLEASVDGAAGPALLSVASVLERNLPRLWTEAWITVTQPLDRFLASHQRRIGPGWFASLGLPFSGTPGMSVRRIRDEHRLVKLISSRLLPAAVDPKSPLRTLQAVRQELWTRQGEKWAFIAEPVPWMPWKPSTGTIAKIWAIAAAALKVIWPVLPIVALAMLAAYVAEADAAGRLWTVAGFWRSMGVGLIGAVIIGLLGLAGYARLRRLEQTDAAEDKSPDRGRVAAIMEQENHAAQNHLFGISDIKPGLVRSIALRFAFALVSQFAGSFRPGFLSDIGSIHFARWIRVPGTNKLVFFSNYGGSWESYLEDFIEKAHYGLTAIWSNTRNFPKTRNLLFEGATDGNRFKRWARWQQAPTLLWYTAYPDLTTSRIRLNAVIRQGVACAATEADAADWLACFGSSPRPPSALDSAEIPSLVFGGLSPLTHGRALVLRLSQPGASAWLDAIEDDLSFGDRLPPGEALFVAFSAAGLKKLGLDERDCRTFPTAFQDGMASPDRARALGDSGENAPARWLWGGRNEADAVMLVYAQSQEALDAIVAARADELQQFGHEVVRSVAFRPLRVDPQQKKNASQLNPEPFGFADGVSQPIVRGTRRWITTRDANHLVEPGEIVLGYPDNRGTIPPSPSVRAADDPTAILPPLGSDPFRDRPDFAQPQPTGERDLGRNGTFLVVRQLEQDVQGFEDYLDKQAKVLRDHPEAPPKHADRREWIAAKLVGRWRDGRSLVRYPHARGKKASKSTQPDNDFLYGQDDPNGLRCPFGAHIRRANPRDSFNPGSESQLKISNRHRLLRVGRSYEPQGELAKPGLFFMCLNADMERQFEFVQQTWALAPSFHGLESEVDCFSARGKTDRMTIPTQAGPICLERLTDFVTVRGGGYFFMPGRRAVRFLASLHRRAGAAAQAASAAAGSQARGQPAPAAE